MENLFTYAGMITVVCAALALLIRVVMFCYQIYKHNKYNALLDEIKTAYNEFGVEYIDNDWVSKKVVKITLLNLYSRQHFSISTLKNTY